VPTTVLPLATRIELGARVALESGMIDLQLGNIDAARRKLENANGLAAENLTRAEQLECRGGLALIEYLVSNSEDAFSYVNGAKAITHGTTLWESGYSAPAHIAAVLVSIDRHDLVAAAELEAAMLRASGPGDFEPLAYAAAGYRRLA
jgi:hypothetical protein